MRVVLIVALAIAAAPATAFAQALDVNVRDSALWARYSSIVSEQRFGQLDADGTVFFGENSRRAIGAGLHVVDNAYTHETPVYVGLGARLLWVDGGVGSGTVLAFGGHGRMTLPDADRISLGGYAYAAPDITAFGRANGYYEIAARGEYHLLESAWLYLGYRYMRAKFKRVPTLTMDSGIHLGMRFSF